MNDIQHPVKVSESQQIAERIAEFIIENGICNPYGGSVSEENKNGKKYKSVAFSQPSNLDGEVRVYNKGFIYIGYQTRYGGLPHHGNHTFKNEQDTLAFLKAAFVDFDFDKANSLM
jgi:hypothetical protein